VDSDLLPISNQAIQLPPHRLGRLIKPKGVKSGTGRAIIINFNGVGE
jgi:hypothetical protein